MKIFVPCSLLPTPCSLFPVPCSLFPLVYKTAYHYRIERLMNLLIQEFLYATALSSHEWIENLKAKIMPTSIAKP
ncbi:hypothetical protein [Moorena producens]|uniref:hypothetical protein n=1 Tax=Moorena producens TaxID=1155739 RepID=UPI003C762F2D